MNSTEHPLGMLNNKKYRDYSIKNLNSKYPDILVSFLTDNMDIANRYAGNIHFSVPNSTEKESFKILRNNTKELSIELNSFWSSKIFIQSVNKESISFIDDKLEKLSEILDS
mgnify:CR=1 FL=1